MATKQGNTARDIVEDVLSPAMTRELWTANYDKVLPLSIQDFDLTAVLPAVFYMFRFGYRRGKGAFLDTFGGDSGTMRERRRRATIARIARVLAQEETFVGFDTEATRAILGDMLLSFCLENRKRALGQQEQVQRVAPAHYMASWIDLPENVVHLRFVPEMIVAMLANQCGSEIQQTQPGEKTWFAVGRGYDENLLLKAFHQGMVSGELLGDRTADSFNEMEPVGLDQLLMIRLAQQLGRPPEKLRGRDERISNQQPIAERMARNFSEDIRRFVRGYAAVIPRHAFLEMLETCMAIGVTTIVTGVTELLFAWAEDGVLPELSEQCPSELFVDCSNGVDRQLRLLAEQSMDDFIRRSERLPIILMAMRLLDYSARMDRKLRHVQTPTRPYATDWINRLGDLLFERGERANAILDRLDERTISLAEALSGAFPEAAEILENEQAEPNPVWRLAEALTLLQGRGVTKKFINLIDSSSLVTQPNGIVMKRRITRRDATARRTTRDVRSLILSDAALDYLVHLHVLRGGSKDGHRPLSFEEFLSKLEERYGLFVDRAPAGMTISNEALQRNRQILERRLRDLGLLVGVNDAEAMKRLVPRFERIQERRHELD